jgi:DNA invertase Pin-like site-specific DNA recombinase
MQTHKTTGQKIGYARVSTDDQNLVLQTDALEAVGCGSIYKEIASGKSSQRLELGYCLKALRAGDTLVVWRLDRLGRSLSDLVRILADLERQGVFFESLTERIETTSATGKLVFHLFAALSEFERNLIRERTHAGLVAARARGRKGGRKPKLDAKDIKQIRALYDSQTVPIGDIANRFGISRTTLYKHVGNNQVTQEH